MTRLLTPPTRPRLPDTTGGAPMTRLLTPPTRPRLPDTTGGAPMTRLLTPPTRLPAASERRPAAVALTLPPEAHA